MSVRILLAACTKRASFNAPSLARALAARRLSSDTRPGPAAPLSSDPGSTTRRSDESSADAEPAEAMTEQQKRNLQHVWGDYVDYMSHQRDKGWKT
mmetsp:Transcript_2734/g.8605  ORF Transcript_2734/g.8605 Transcript_2734/m.8605 type:complete len:96 (+) Transcript_2734:166-453(+)|eukprot:CAMPEP_0197387612 /NCGR_PEP_ID=MMETSP1165-20131217/629_1 /TAXON_ID=284809 /ORGANISM="Chrysocystis fragilis, Strain CCMP3189" /LENGTH=95 /DNA_ID=CAMNT_0042912943 /DNA_START=163 /DNA_END=450 /DNA_ORIENTATION=+